MRSETPSNSTDGTGPGDGLVRAGAIVFLIGAVATLVTVAPLFLGTEPFPPVAYGVCMLMGLGFLIAAAGVLRSIAVQRRRARSAG
ncbi:SUR7/PalI family protein [Streptomyces sp. LP05-1]|uniref:SUR7/PalI family protein n=1 Tax=Streptomyces pyxinae TaxID=2970734 RepID=A0ABT2CEX2_9ACTN|nr:SUR7/PalI family protein [Streptomyces sp. LP05-1]MCS0635964.1 SUR7/PalI family protein [Streptomyces sp. LP05-1]